MRQPSHIEIGFQVYAVEGGEEFGAVRGYMPNTNALVVDIENAGDVVVPLEAVQRVHDGKVIVDVGQLDARLREAIAHAQLGMILIAPGGPISGNELYRRGEAVLTCFLRCPDVQLKPTAFFTRMYGAYGRGSACPSRKTEVEPIHLLGNRSSSLGRSWGPQAG
jgi:hypothetical protein